MFQQANAAKPLSIAPAAGGGDPDLPQALTRLIAGNKLAPDSSCGGRQAAAFKGGVSEALSGAQFMVTHRAVQGDGSYRACGKFRKKDGKDESVISGREGEHRCCVIGFHRAEAAVADLFASFDDDEARTAALKEFETEEDKETEKTTANAKQLRALNGCHEQFMAGQAFAGTFCGALSERLPVRPGTKASKARPEALVAEPADRKPASDITVPAPLDDTEAVLDAKASELTTAACPHPATQPGGMPEQRGCWTFGFMNAFEEECKNSPVFEVMRKIRASCSERLVPSPKEGDSVPSDEKPQGPAGRAWRAGS